jgi:3-phosphoglycerate kinase
MNKLKGIQNANLTGRIFLRLDLDVPLSEEGIEDDSRLKAGLETIDFLLKTAEKVIIVCK